MNYAEAIEHLVVEFHDKIERLAEKYRASVLLPLCKKHKLNYISGNGTFYFYPAGEGELYDSSWSVSTVDDAILERKKYLIPVLEVLNQEITHDDYLGFYVADITDQDSL